MAEPNPGVGPGISRRDFVRGTGGLGVAALIGAGAGLRPAHVDAQAIEHAPGFLTSLDAINYTAEYTRTAEEKQMTVDTLMRLYTDGVTFGFDRNEASIKMYDNQLQDRNWRKIYQFKLTDAPASTQTLTYVLAESSFAYWHVLAPQPLREAINSNPEYLERIMAYGLASWIDMGGVDDYDGEMNMILNSRSIHDQTLSSSVVKLLQNNVIPPPLDIDLLQQTDVLFTEDRPRTKWLIDQIQDLCGHYALWRHLEKPSILTSENAQIPENSTIGGPFVIDSLTEWNTFLRALPQMDDGSINMNAINSIPTYLELQLAIAKNTAVAPLKLFPSNGKNMKSSLERIFGEHYSPQDGSIGLIRSIDEVPPATPTAESTSTPTEAPTSTAEPISTSTEAPPTVTPTSTHTTTPTATLTEIPTSAPPATNTPLSTPAPEPTPHPLMKARNVIGDVLKKHWKWAAAAAGVGAGIARKVARDNKVKKDAGPYDDPGFS